MTRRHVGIIAAVLVSMMVLLLIFVSGGKKNNKSTLGQITSTGSLELSEQLADPSGTTVSMNEQETTSTIPPGDALQEVTEAVMERPVFVLPEKGLRPYAVMIDNAGSGCLPQGGLDQAQVIYEVIVEGGYTRLMPVYWGVTPKMLGPVRSARHYFLDYAMEHDAVYVHFGWSPQAQSDIGKLKINNINGILNGGGIFSDLTGNGKNWQDSYTTGEKVVNYSKYSKYKTTTEKSPVFEYAVDEVVIPDTDQKAERITLKYSHGYYCSFTYNEEEKLYLRYRLNDPQIERSTGNQLTAQNIIVQRIPNRTIPGDREGRQEVDTVGTGKGWFITCGKAVEIKWSKASRREPTKYTDMQGNPIVLNAGQTWVQIVPTSGKVTIE